MYSKDKAQVNTIYRKKITLIGNELEVAQIFFQKFVRIASKTSNKFEDDENKNDHNQNLSLFSVPNLDSSN